MAGRNYDRLPIEQFGKHLLISGDLDPVYIALNTLQRDGVWSPGQVHRWLVAYWCLYHCGAASYLSHIEGKRFWSWLMQAAVNEQQAPNGGRWPRGHERRHWRGQQAVKSCQELQDRYDHPEQMVEYVVGQPDTGSTRDFTSVAKRAQEHRGFGPWISFKIGDMVDRCLGQEVDFTEGHIFMFKDPAQAALRVWREKEQVPECFKPKNKAVQDQIIHTVVGHLESVFAGLTAPPYHDRPIGLQEVETVLCKWKSHMNGHYPLNNDIDEIREGLDGWGTAAAQFAAAMPEPLPFQQT